MRRKEFIIVFFLLSFIVSIFFYKTIIYRLIPFPGDLLIAEYNPWKTYSYLGYVPGSFPNKAQYFDVLRQLYPWKTFIINSLRHFNLPLWNPYNFSGVPLLANFQSAVFYPLNIFYLLPQIWAWTILITIQPLLTTFFTYLYVRKIDMGRLGAIFSAISFSFSSFLTVWLEYNTIGQVILWLPLSLLCIENLLEKKSAGFSFLFTFSLVASLLGGHIQVFFYSLFFLLIYILFRSITFDKKRASKNILFFVFLIILVLGLGAIQLFPGIELIMNAARSPHQYDFLVNKILIQPWQLIMFFIPDFFGNPATRNYWLADTYVGKVTSIGLVSIIFILFGIFSKKKMKKFFIWVCLAILLLVTNNPITAFLYKINIPLVSGSSPTLLVFLFCFGISILAGIGVDRITKEGINLKRYLSFALPIMLLYAIFYFAVLIFIKTNAYGLAQNLKISLRNLSYSTAIITISSLILLLSVRKKKMLSLVLIGLFLLNVFDLFRSFEKFNPFSPKETVFPKAPVLEFLKRENGIDRFWGYGAANTEANFATQYKLFSPDGYDPLYPKTYGEFIQASKDGKIETNFNLSTRSDAKIAQGFGETGFFENPYRLKILDLLGVKYIVDRAENNSSEKTFPPDRFKLIYSENGWKVFENIKSLPRAFLGRNYKVYNSIEEFERLFFDQSFDPSKTVLLEKDPKTSEVNNLAIKQFNNNNVSEVSLVRHEPDEIAINVNASSSNSFLFLSDTYYPGWKAYVDGKESPIYKADFTFRSVFVPAGNHKVIFLYDPLSFKIGLLITAASALALLIFVFILRVYKRT